MTASDSDSDSVAVGIYAVMARDACDALEMVQACDDRRALELLRSMLTHPGGQNTDRGLNSLFVGPVERRLGRLVRPPEETLPAGEERSMEHEESPATETGSADEPATDQQKDLIAVLAIRGGEPIDRHGVWPDPFTVRDAARMIEDLERAIGERDLRVAVDRLTAFTQAGDASPGLVRAVKALLSAHEFGQALIGPERTALEIYRDACGATYGDPDLGEAVAAVLAVVDRDGVCLGPEDGRGRVTFSRLVDE